MKYFNFSIATIILLLTSIQSGAQGYYFYDDRHYEGPLLMELAIKTGGMNALTDIGGKSGPGKKGLHDLNLSFTRPCISFFATLMYKNNLGVRIQYSTGNVTAADSILKNVRGSTRGRYERNLSFRSPVREFALLIECHPLNFRNDYLRDKEPSRFSPYILAGAGIFSFDPQAKLDGTWYSLQPLHTEGQGFSIYPDRKPYLLRQLNWLTGAGIKYEINSWLNGRVEFTHRFLKTDYLDDVSRDSYVPPGLFDLSLPPSMASLARALADRRAEVDPGHTTNPTYQRGNPSDNDAYFTMEIGLGIVLGRRRR